MRIMELSDEARKRIGWRKGIVFTCVKKTCEVCGKEFKTVPSSTKQHCCSRKCQFQRLVKPKQIMKCQFCGEEYIPKAHKRDTKFCSKKCASQSRWVGHIYKTRPSEVLPRKQMKHCSICRYSKLPQILERHHKDFNHRNNSKDNLQVLCPNCHDEVHFYAGNGVKHRQVHG